MSKVIPIVKIAFILDFVKCSNTKQLLPDPNEHVPNLNADQFIITPGYSLVPNIERKNVFLGKTITFSTMGEMVSPEKRSIVCYAKQPHVELEPTAMGMAMAQLVKRRAVRVQSPAKEHFFLSSYIAEHST